MSDSPKRAVDLSDLLKLNDALCAASEFFKRRDEMNAKVHLGEPRYSPITSLVDAAYERVRTIVDP